MKSLDKIRDELSQARYKDNPEKRTIFNFGFDAAINQVQAEIERLKAEVERLNFLDGENLMLDSQLEKLTEASKAVTAWINLDALDESHPILKLAQALASINGGENE